jgi:hypothetical protein
MQRRQGGTANDNSPLLYRRRFFIPKKVHFYLERFLNELKIRGINHEKVF